jgi:cell wall-associated NlpC family hydrolase
MPFLVCVVPVCPIRLEPSHRSEQVSQLLFGDIVEILETGKDFIRVRYLYDDYEGWCQRSQLEEISQEHFSNKVELLTGDLLNEVKINGQLMNVPLGCSLGHLQQGKNLWGNVSVEYSGSLWEPTHHLKEAGTIRDIAMKYLNTGYQWGGRSVFGVDCSGFCQMVFRFAGIPLLRDAYQQASQGEAIGFLQEARCGDLAFFDNEEARITHVGILLDPSSIIHSSGKVRIDTIDHQGIINAETGLRTHRLRVIKRIF